MVDRFAVHKTYIRIAKLEKNPYLVIILNCHYLELPFIQIEARSIRTTLSTFSETSKSKFLIWEMIDL